MGGGQRGQRGGAERARFTVVVGHCGLGRSGFAEVVIHRVTQRGQQRRELAARLRTRAHRRAGQPAAARVDQAAPVIRADEGVLGGVVGAVHGFPLGCWWGEIRVGV
ncbi:hypothetical protein A4R43_37550 [Amycolatopsis albispora]|uniref:Uncharacterized protein n=1 Tax=Amycolatopsis albispora TaxID=1804986 RepID=A0A344LHD7_9PSEU|nr:hypothetical protein A4R43_37550 [Amycolatopsis albispora]